METGWVDEDYVDQFKDQGLTYDICLVEHEKVTLCSRFWLGTEVQGGCRRDKCYKVSVPCLQGKLEITAPISCAPSTHISKYFIK